MKILETERLLLRPFVLEDVVGLHQEIYSDSEVVCYYSGNRTNIAEFLVDSL